jgi:hypothetical protein
MTPHPARTHHPAVGRRGDDGTGRAAERGGEQRTYHRHAQGRPDLTGGGGDGRGHTGLGPGHAGHGGVGDGGVDEPEADPEHDVGGEQPGKRGGGSRRG